MPGRRPPLRAKELLLGAAEHLITPSLAAGPPLGPPTSRAPCWAPAWTPSWQLPRGSSSTWRCTRRSIRRARCAASWRQVRAGTTPWLTSSPAQQPRHRLHSAPLLPTNCTPLSTCPLTRTGSGGYAFQRPAHRDRRPGSLPECTQPPQVPRLLRSRCLGGGSGGGQQHPAADRPAGVPCRLPLQPRGGGVRTPATCSGAACVTP